MTRTFASDFTPILAQKAEEAIQSTNKTIIFIGRPTCPYCQRFEPKLRDVAKSKGLDIYYLNSENSQDLAAVQGFRTKYQIPTVPGLLVAEAGSVKVVCDSSLSPEEIAAFIA